MSVNFYLACDDCKKKIWVGTEFFVSRFNYFSEDGEVQKLLESFFKYHLMHGSHVFCLFQEQDDKYYRYSDW